MAEPVPRMRSTLSLRAYLMLLVVGTTVPAVIVAVVLITRVVIDGREAVARQVLEAARASAAIVDTELQGTIRALQGLGQSDRLTNEELPQFYAQATGLLATQGTWSAISLSTPDGHQIINTARTLGESLPFATDTESFQRAVRTSTPVIGNLRVGSVTQQQGFPVRVPVVRNGVVIYVLSAWITSDRFSSVLSRQTSLSNEWARGVVDASGVVVARSRDPERFVGQKGTPAFLKLAETRDEAVYRDVTLEGTPVYSAFSRAQASRWITGVAVPVSAVDASFRNSMVALATIVALLVGFGGGGAYVISRRIARDISNSTAEAEAIVAGRPPSHVETHVLEVQRLVDALERSAALLDARQRERDEQLARADAARAEAEAADRAKDEFLAMLGHELRNPLAPALTAVHLMKLRATTTEGARERDIIDRQIRHMARLVDDLLDVSRLRRGAIELKNERFDLQEAVTRAVEITSPIVAEKRHQLEVAVPSGLIIDADKIRIAQVLSNLLSNAAKYTEPGGHIALRARPEGDQVVVECVDNGMGMSADLLPHVFDLFVQGPRTIDRRQGGLGLGLAVARTLVELHGGTIEARSGGRDRGSSFEVRLPRAAATAAEPPVEESRIAAIRPVQVGRVLVVDDNQDALDTLVDAMKLAGHDTVGASTPQEALEVAARFPPRVAVLDIGLPGMDGFDLARELRARANGTPIRLIALTGYGRAQDIASARAAGFDAFFVKPIDIPKLLDALERPSIDPIPKV